MNTGIQSALARAKADANGKDVRIQGGANVIQQYVNAGLVDEFMVHIAPVMIGRGIRLFDDVDRRRFTVEIIESIDSSLVTHIRYRVNNRRPGSQNR
ncbi:MAG: dihydrofolate reductase family protein [Longimicrobiales bacterium]